ncbi:MAG: hypothetical protein K8R16_05175 [Anaerolineales bacterium]|nr:hypothetical protein [Anaerolineales bacterium]
MKLKVTNLEKSLSKVIEIRNKTDKDISVLICKFDWDQRKDIRIVSLIKILRFLIALQLSLHSLINMADTEYEHWSDLKLPRPIDEDIEGYLLAYKSFIEISFISSLFSIIESTIRAYYQHIDSNEYEQIKKSTYKVTNKFLLEKLDREFTNGLEWVDFMRNIRNVIHNNGVFSPIDGKSRTMIYKDNEYRFIPGKLLHFVEWPLLLDLVNDFRELMFQISIDENICSLPGTIPEPFRKSEIDGIL